MNRSDILNQVWELADSNARYDVDYLIVQEDWDLVLASGRYVAHSFDEEDLASAGLSVDDVAERYGHTYWDRVEFWSADE